MCGIVGLINGEPGRVTAVNVEQFLLAGCITGVLRGMDSTGMYQVLKNDSVKVWKRPVDGGTFAQLKVTQSMIRDSDTCVATIIHHRAATHGLVTQDNCHPFQHENATKYIVGVHNGGYAGFSRKEDGISFDVDSDWLYYQILKHGPAKALGSLPSTAAYALVWYDQELDRHYIATNGERPLSFGFVKGKNIMLIASEHPHLYWLANRSGIEFEEALWSPKKDLIYEFDAANLREYKTIALEKPAITLLDHAASGYRHRRWNDALGVWDDAARVSPPVVRNTISNDTETHKVSTSYVSSELDATGVNRAKNYHFWPMEGLEDPVLGGAPPRLVTGILADPDDPTVALEAVCNVWTALNYDNLRNCDYATASPSGVRTLIDKETGEVTRQIIVSDTREYTFSHNDKGATFYRGPRGKDLTEEQFTDMVQSGCIGCGAPITVLDSEFMSWVNNGKDPCCPSCTQDIAYMNGAAA